MARGFDILASDKVPPAGGNSDDSTARAVQEVIEQLRKDFKERNLLYERIENVVHGRIPIKVPSAFQNIATIARSPLPMVHKNTITAALSTNPPKVNVRPLGFGESWDTNATLREHFFDASWKRQELEARRPLLRAFMDALVMKGEAILKTVERSKRAWADYGSVSSKALKDLMDESWQRKSTDERRREYDRRTELYKQAAPYPIATTDVLPETFYYLKTEDGFTFCAEVKQVPYLDTLARFAYGVGPNGRVVPQAMALPFSEWSKSMSGETTLTMVEAWTWKRCYYILLGPGQSIGAGSVVKTFDHGYGDPATKTLRGPYFHALGLTSHERLPHRAGLSLLYPFLDLYVLYDNVRTMRAVNAHNTAYAAYKDATTPEGSLPPDSAPFGRDGTEAARKSITVEPGKVLPGDIEPIEQPKAGVDFNIFEQTIRADLDMAVPKILQGIIDDTDNGWQLAQGVHLARLGWDPLIDNAQRALSERTGFESRLIEERIRERVYARGEVTRGTATKQGSLSIGPEDLNGLHDVYEVTLDPKLPSTRVVDLRFHGEMTERGFETQADAITDLGGNPDEVRLGRMREQYEDSDEMKARVFQRVDQILGQQAQAALQDAAQAAGQPPAGSALGGIGNPMVPGQNLPLEPTPQAPPGATAPLQGGTVAGEPGGIQAEHLAAASESGGLAGG